MKILLATLAVMSGILAQAWGQDTVRINNTTKAVISPIPFRVGQSAVDPTAPGNGSIWYDTATNTLEARINGATVNLGSTTITGADTQVMFFDGANTPAGDAGMTYNKTTDTIAVGGITIGGNSLTINGATSITGGGTLALAGFTFTAPGAGGTLVTTATLSTGGLAGAFTTLSASGVFTGSAGAAGAPAINLGAATTGFYSLSAGAVWAFTQAGTARFRLGGGTFAFGSTGSLEWRDNADPTSGASDLTLFRDAANTLAQRNTTNAQTLRVYGTWTNASNGDWLSVSKAAAGAVTILSTANGTGTGGDLIFGVPVTAGAGVAATNVWKIGAGASAGHFLAVTDNTYDIGASGATRPRTVYVGTELNCSGMVRAAPASGFYLSGQALFSSTADGIMTLDGNAVHDVRVRFGGTTASFPALKRSTTSLQVRLADDSADAPIRASLVESTSTVRLKDYTVATLPAGVQGDSAFVTDATAPTYLGALTGGGAVRCPVFYNGTAWVSH